MFPSVPQRRFLRHPLGRVPRFGALAVLAVAASFVVAGNPAGATTVGDEAALRAAFTDGAETAIDLSTDITLTCAGGGVVTRTADVPLTITGHGHTLTQSCAFSLILNQDGSGALTISDLHVASVGEGISTAGGGGTAPLQLSAVTFAGALSGTAVTTGTGALTMTDVAITGYTKGVQTHGDATLTRTSITGMSNVGFESSGGGVTEELDYSSITGSGNLGVIIDDGTLRLFNTTVSDNPGGGIRADHANIDLLFATVVNNGTDVSPAFRAAVEIPEGRVGFSGANIEDFSGSLNATASVIAFPGTGNSNCQTDGNVTGGYNFSDDASCGLTDPTDHASAGDPQLGSLQNNGGAGLTRKPAVGSPLIDAIPSGVCPFGAANVHDDELGQPRPSGGSCDIGAFELQAAVAPTTTTTSTTSTTSTVVTTTTTTPVAVAPTAIVATPAFTG